MDELLGSLSRIFTTAFAISSMLSMGLNMTVAQIIEPLRNLRLTILALVANFVIVPAAAFLISSVIPLDPDLRTGLILASMVAGAPLTVKLAQIARGSVTFGTALVALLVIGTVIYLPLVLPQVLPGVQVDAGALAQPLVLQILLPLAIGLVVRARYPEEAGDIQPAMGQISNISLALMLVLTVGLNIGDVLGLFGTGAILSIILLIAVGLVTGYLLGGPDTNTKRVLSLGTGQRNLAAAFVIGAGNFADRPNVLLMLGAIGLMAMLIVMPVAGEFGKRAAAEEAGGSAAPAMAEGAGGAHP